MLFIAVKAKEKETTELKAMLDLLTNDLLDIRREQKEMREIYEKRTKEQDDVVNELKEKLAKFGRVLELSTRNADLETSLLPSLFNASQVC